MSKRRFVISVVLLTLLTVLTTTNLNAQIRTFVSIAPQAYLVRQVGGPLVEVEILVPPGGSPTTYEPTSQQLTRLAEAEVLFTTGVAFEKRLLNKIAGEFQNLRIVPAHESIELRTIERHDQTDHKHEGALDPHVWLDPTLAAIQAAKIASVLSEVQPSAADTFQRNLENLRLRLDSADTAIKNILAPVKGRTIFVFHPAYGYFADAYGLKQVAIETHGKEPSARQLASLVEQATRDSVGVVFVQPQFSRRQAESVGKSIGARVETLDPLAEDYINNLLDMAAKIAEALSGNKE